MPASAETNALFKAALADPADELPRLVFADWLEDSGTSDNAAWARYIRLGTVTHCGPMLPAERTERRLLAGLGVRAKLAVPLSEFVGNSAALFQLLPAPNITVKIANATVPIPVVQQVREDLAREHLLMPVEWSGWHANGRPKYWQERTLVVASADPGELRDKLNREEVWLSAGQIHCVAADLAELTSAIVRSYANLRQESAVRSLLLGFPVEFLVEGAGPAGTLDIPPVVRLLHGIFADAIYRQVSVIRMAPQNGGLAVSMRDGAGWTTWNFVPGWLAGALVAELRSMAGLRAYSLGVQVGTVRFDHRRDRYELALELTETTRGPDVTIQITDPIRPR